MKLKLKTKKSAIKRVKIKKCFLACKRPFKSHLLRKKSKKTLRFLLTFSKIHKADLTKFLLMLGH